MATIAEILLARGAQEADARRRQGEITGQMWSNLANIATNAGQQIAQQQANAPRLALERMAVQDAQQRQQGQQAIDQALKPYIPVGPQPEGAGPAQPQHPYLNDQTGLYETSKLSDMLAANGLAHLAPDLLKPVENINDSITKHQQLQQKLNDATTVMYGDMAHGVQTLRQKMNLPIDQALDMATMSARATGRINPAQYQQIKTQLSALPPEQQDAALNQYMDAAAQVSGDETLSKDAMKLDRYGRVKASNIVPERPTTGELESKAMDAYARQNAGTATAADLNTIAAWEKLHPKAQKEPKSFEVTVPGPHGPLRKLFSEEEMRAGVPSFQAPQQPIVVQTATGPELVNRGAGTASPIMQAGTNQAVQAPVPAAMQLEQSKKSAALASLNQLDKAIEDAKDLIGPGSGRISSIEQTVGNPDPKIAALGTKLLLAKMQVDAGIGGTRAAASPQLLARWDNLLAQKLTPEALHASVQAMRDIIGIAPAGGGISSKKMSAEELIKKYGGGQ